VDSMGRIEQVGKPEAIRARQTTECVKDFITA
jgi:ABC-type Fe3+/spermidine/putrescine transport system ATPase subunit